MNSDFGRNNGLRSYQRSKRRKTNLILNSLIALVLLLIIVVSFIIFGNDEKADNAEEQNNVENTDSGNEGASKNNENPSGSAGQDSEDDETEKEIEKDEETDKDKDKEPEQADKDSEVVTEGGDDPNVRKTITNPDWKPIGTAQSAPYSDSDIDWDERERALAYALGFEVNNMTIWYLGRDGTHASIGTISQKGDAQSYRVYLEWKDEGGWTPVKVEELIKNDKR